MSHNDARFAAWAGTIATLAAAAAERRRVGPAAHRPGVSGPQAAGLGIAAAIVRRPQPIGVGWPRIPRSNRAGEFAEI